MKNKTKDKKSYNKYYFLWCFFLLLPVVSFSQKQARVDSLLILLTHVKEDSIRVNVLTKLCWELKSTNPKKAVGYGEKALALSEKINFKSGEALANNNLGSAYAEMGDYQKGLLFYKKALEIRKLINSKGDIAISLNNVGLAHNSLGNYEESLKYLLEALTVVEEDDDVKIRAMVYVNLSGTYYHLKKNDKALKYLQKALEMYDRVDDKRAKATCLNNMAAIYSNQNKKEEALDYFQQALLLREELGDVSGIAMCMSNIGGLLSDQGDYSKAVKYLQKALEINIKLGNQQDIAVIFHNLGDLNHQLKKYEEAEEYYLQSLKRTLETNYKELSILNYLNLAKNYASAGNYEKAYEFNQLHLQLKDSVFNEQSSKQIAEMQTRYESEKKEKEIELLTKEREVQDLELQENRVLVFSFSAGSVLVLMLAFVLFRGYRQKQKANLKLAGQNKEIIQQKIIIEQKNKDITDSIIYAQRIQQAILPSDSLFNEKLKDSFIFYKPKDIVSGDFYWVAEAKSGLEGNKADVILFAAVDCTGHGVPGAFMSIVGHNALNQAVNEYNLKKPSDILDHLNKSVNETLKTNEESNIKDGMDISVCSIDIVRKKLEYAGAYNPLYLIRNNALIETKADKQPIGAFLGDSSSFTNHEIELQAGDTVYIFTDGYADQFGGEKGKKFKQKPFQELLLSIQKKTMAEQRIALEKNMEKWKGNLEQVDDICVIGVRI